MLLDSKHCSQRTDNLKAKHHHENKSSMWELNMLLICYTDA